MSVAATEAAAERRRRKRLPLDELVKLEVDELFAALAKVPKAKWIQVLAQLLSALALVLRRLTRQLARPRPA